MEKIRKKRAQNKYKKPNKVIYTIQSKITQTEFDWLLEQAEITGQTISYYVRSLIKKTIKNKN